MQLQEVKADNERLNEEKQKMEESIASSTEAYQWSLSKVEQQVQQSILFTAIVLWRVMLQG